MAVTTQDFYSWAFTATETVSGDSYSGIIYSVSPSTYASDQKLVYGADETGGAWTYTVTSGPNLIPAGTPLGSAGGAAGLLERPIDRAVYVRSYTDGETGISRMPVGYGFEWAPDFPKNPSGLNGFGSEFDQVDFGGYRSPFGRGYYEADYPSNKTSVVTQLSDGRLDFLLFTGAALTQSALTPYSLWTVVANGDFSGDGKIDLVTQHNGQINFVYGVTATGIQSSWLVSGSFWDVKGQGNFGQRASGPALVTQDSEGGQINLLWFDKTGALVESRLLEGSYWSVVGAADFNNDGLSEIVTQSLQGEIDILYFEGTKLAASALVPGTYAPIKEVDNWQGFADLTTQDSAGSINHLYFSGNTLVASLAQTPALPGFSVVDAGHLSDQIWYL